MFAKNNEEERSKLWNIVMIVSTILIVLIVVFFVVKIFIANPLEGTWMNDGGDLTITIGSGEEAQIQWPEKLSDSDANVDMRCTVDTKNKTIHLQFDDEELKQASEVLKQTMTEKEIDFALRSIEGTFEYSLDGKNLTLSDCEYGEQFFFEKQ